MKGLTFRIVLGTSIFLFILSAWYLWDKKHNQSPFSAIPNDAIAIGKFNSYHHFDSTMIEEDLWLEMLLEHKVPQILHDTTAVANTLKNSDFTTSLHRTSQKDYHLLFYFPFTEHLESIYDSLLIKQGFTQRTLFGETLFENKELTLYLSNSNQLIVSRSSLLVEDVIRKLANPLPLFNRISSFPNEVESFSKQQNLFIDFSKVNLLFSTFIQDANRSDDLLSHFSKMGIWVGSKSQRTWQGRFLKNEQENWTTLPDSSIIYQWIPANSHSVQYQQFKEGKSIQQFLKADETIKPINRQLKKEYDFVLDDFYETLSGEFAFFNSSLGGVSLANYLFLQSNDIEITQEQLELLPKKLIQTYSSIPLNLQEVQVYQIEAPLFKDALGNYKPYFASLYFAIIGDYLLLSSHPSAMKNYFDQLERGNNLEKNKQFLSFRDSLPNNTTQYTYWNATLFFASMEASTKKEWKALFQTYKEATLKEDFLASYNLSDADSFVMLTQKEKLQNQLEVIPDGTEKNLIPFKYTLNNGPKLVRNHNDWSIEFLMRDRAHYLTLVSEQGKKQWALPTRQPIQTKIWQIDRYANGKLQYLFAVNHQIFLVDRLGRVVRNFPLKLPFKQQVKQLSVLDYEGAKNYRILASDKSGDVYMFSKYGTLLKNWNPKRFQAELATEVKHIRVEHQDFLLVLLTNGTLHALYPNGQSHKGFPINFNESLGEEYHLKQGSTRENTALSFITPRGEKIAVNLKGEVLKRELLPSTNETATYKIHLSEGSQSNWIVSRATKNKITLFNDNGKVLIETDFSQRNRPLVQYFEFGKQKGLLSITNARQGGTSIYNLEGKLIASLDKNRYPIIALQTGSYKARIYHSVRNKLAKLDLNFL